MAALEGKEMEEGIFRDFKIVVENVQCVNVQT
jgi:hypothetical protein